MSSTSKIVSAREAQSQFGSLVQWATENSDGVVVERRGKPSAAIIPYELYEEISRLRHLEKKVKALETLRSLRTTIQNQAEGLPDEEMYFQAGFGKRAIESIMQNDKELSES